MSFDGRLMMVMVSLSRKSHNLPREIWKIIDQYVKKPSEDFKRMISKLVKNGIHQVLDERDHLIKMWDPYICARDVFKIFGYTGYNLESYRNTPVYNKKNRMISQMIAESYYPRITGPPTDFCPCKGCTEIRSRYKRSIKTPKSGYFTLEQEYLKNTILRTNPSTQ